MLPEGVASVTAGHVNSLREYPAPIADDAGETHFINDTELLLELIQVAGADTTITMQANNILREPPSIKVKIVHYLAKAFEQISRLYPNINWHVGKNELVDRRALELLMKDMNGKESKTDGTLYLISKIDANTTTNSKLSVAVCLELSSTTERFAKVFIPDLSGDNPLVRNEKVCQIGTADLFFDEILSAQ